MSRVRAVRFSIYIVMYMLAVFRVREWSNWELLHISVSCIAKSEREIQGLGSGDVMVCCSVWWAVHGLHYWYWYLFFFRGTDK